MSDPIIFRDGYTRRIKIKGERGLYGDAEFEIRPLLAEERDELAAVVQSQPPKKFNAVIRAMMAKNVLSWNATDAAGLPVPITAANVARMPPRLYDRLYWILTGRDAGDLPDDVTDEEADDYAARMLTGSEGDAKN